MPSLLSASAFSSTVRAQPDSCACGKNSGNTTLDLFTGDVVGVKRVLSRRSARPRLCANVLSGVGGGATADGDGADGDGADGDGGLIARSQGSLTVSRSLGILTTSSILSVEYVLNTPCIAVEPDADVPEFRRQNFGKLGVRDICCPLGILVNDGTLTAF